MPSLRYHKSTRRKKGQRGHLPGQRRDRGATICSQLYHPFPPVHMVLEPPGSGLRLPGQSGTGVASGGPSARERTSGSAAPARGRGPGGGSPPLPPAEAGCSQRRRRYSLSPPPPRPPSPASGSRPHPAPPVRTPGGRARAPSAALLRRAPGAGVRPSRGYITGPGPSGAARGRRAQTARSVGAAAHLP